MDSHPNAPTETVGEAYHVTRSSSLTSGLPPRKELWYDDGSIVLASDAHLYRVHKSMLAKHSAVLKDLLSSEATEFWEGLPIKKMIDDSDDEVFILLKSLYNRK